MRIPKVAWWLGAGGLLLWLANRGEAQASEKLGNLVIRIEFKPNSNTLPVVNAVLNSILAVRSTVCPTFPDVKTGVGVPSVSGSVVTTTMVAAWKHDILGPIKEEVRQCFLGYLQGINPNVVNVTAERVS
jgi:hypothetical protein